MSRLTIDFGRDKSRVGFFLEILLLTLIFAAFLAGALESAAGAESPSFRMVISPPGLSGYANTRCLVTTPLNKFVFAVPNKFKVGNDSSRHTIILSAPDHSCSIFVKITEGGALGSDFRERALQSNPGAEITEEFTTSAAGKTCHGFQMRQTIKSLGVHFRIVFVPFPEGEIELKLTVPVRPNQSLDNGFSLLNDVSCSLWQAGADTPWPVLSKKFRLE